VERKKKAMKFKENLKKSSKMRKKNKKKSTNLRVFTTKIKRMTTIQAIFE